MWKNWLWVKPLQLLNALRFRGHIKTTHGLTREYLLIHASFILIKALIRIYVHNSSQMMASWKMLLHECLCAHFSLDTPVFVLEQVLQRCNQRRGDSLQLSTGFERRSLCAVRHNSGVQLQKVNTTPLYFSRIITELWSLPLMLKDHDFFKTFR